MKHHRIIAAILCCGGLVLAEETEPSQKLSALPAEAPSPPDNPSSPDKVALGRQLFFDPLLSATREVACATCHLYIHPDWWDKCLPDGEKSDEEEDMLDLGFDLRKTSRLSCQIMVSDALDGLVVAVPGAKTGW